MLTAELEGRDAEGERSAPGDVAGNSISGSPVLTSGVKFEPKLEGPLDSQKKQAAATIHGAGALAGAIGLLSPIPGPDAALIAPIQAILVLRLASLYGVRPSSAALRSAGYAALGQVVGKGSARVLAALIPGMGSIVRGGVAASMTEAIGWAVIDNLEEGDAP